MAIELSIYQVDAFADAVFGGNPAAVVPMREWLPDPLLQQIAAENNLSETAFLIPDGGGYALRWFTPATEVELCGHATLASASIVFEFLKPASRQVSFTTRRAGTLPVAQRPDGLLEMDFPARPPEPATPPPGLASALGAQPREILAHGMMTVARFEHEDEVRRLAPDFRALGKVPCGGVIATAPGEEFDFVSRFFGPKVGIDEDPVTGSAHCLLVPFWARRLGKATLIARQISARGGTIRAEHKGDRVLMAGRTRLYLEGRIFLQN